MKPGSNLLRNAALLSITGAVAKLLFLLTSIAIYRVLSKEDAGVFFTGLTFAVTAILVSELGLRGYMIRELALVRDDKARSSSTFQSLLTARILLLFSSLPIMLLILIGAKYAPRIVFCATGLWVYAALESLALFFKSALRSYERMEYDAIFSFVGRSIVLATVWCLAAWQKATLLGLVCAFAIGPAVELAGLACVLWLNSPLSLRPNLNFSRIGLLIKLSAPFAVAVVCGALNLRAGTFVLSRIESIRNAMSENLPGAGIANSISSEVAVAEFNAAGRIPDALSFLPLAIVNAALPFLTRNYGNPEIIKIYFNLIMKYLGLGGVAVSVFTLLEPQAVILLVAGSDYLNAVLPFQVYGATVFFSFLQYATANLLICLRLERPLVRRYLFCLITNVTLSLILSPLYGVAGAAAAYLLSEMLAMMLDVLLLRNAGFHIAGRTVVTWLVPGLMLLVVSHGLHSSEWLLRAGIGITCVTALIAALGYRDRRRFRTAASGTHN